MGYVESLLAENEEIVIRTRQHWMVLARSFVLNLVLLILIVLLAFAASVALAPLGMSALGMAVALLAAIPVLAFVREYLEWWNEEYLVTTMRVIQAEGIINKHVIDSSLEKVNDVVLNQSFLGRMFDYGDIEILTASEVGVNQLHKIVEPVKFKTEMLNQKERLGFDEHRSAGSGRDDIPSLLIGLDELRKRGVLTEEEFQQKKSQLLAKM
jgi:uncharacterized membrane protein YdbT with pleckstrin-like domain